VTIRAWLFDADGEDHEVELSPKAVPARGTDRLLWVDVDERSTRDLGRVAKLLDLDSTLLARLGDAPEHAKLTQYPEHIHLSLATMEPPGEGEPGRSAGIVRPEQRSLDLVAGAEWVVSVHDGSLPAIDRLREGTHGETRVGVLESSDFLASIVDSVIVGYHRTVEAFESEIDGLDEIALRARPKEDVLGRLVDLRRRLGAVRRSLVPQREAFAPLGRPDMAVHKELGRPWPGLLARLERALDAVEHLRESLIGTYDIYMGRLAQRSNDVMKALTVLSAILLPAVVLAGVMGMNFKVGFFDDPSFFFVVIAVMGAMAAAILGVARWRGWI
jgi:magnesium transporter